MNSENDELFYKGEKINLGIPLNKLKENLLRILNPANIEKYINNEDFARLSKFLPNNNNNNIEFMKNLLSPNKYSDTLIRKYPLQIFENMLNKNYFTINYQHNIEKLKLEGIEEYINLYENTYNHISKNFEKYCSQLSSRENENISGADMAQQDYYLNFDNNEVIFETNSYLASSGYTTLNSEDEKESQQNEIFIDQTNDNETLTKPLDAESGLEGSLSEERFKNLKMNKNQLTIKSRTKEEIKEFHRQELERYKFPHLPWAYNNSDGSMSVVSPVQKKIPTGTVSKPRDHVMLKSDRPAYVTILCLARDAASRLPEGVGTRADICDLLKDSQYINERLSDAQINNIVSGALDRLHYEKDPCVKYDLQKKLWIYLHRNRTLDYPPWNEHLLSKEQKLESKIELSLHSEDKLDEKESNAGTAQTPVNSSAKKVKTKEKLLKNKRKLSK